MKSTILAAVSLVAVAVAVPAIAADMAVRMPTKAPPAAFETAYSWSGLYIGGHVGYGWGDSQTTIVTASGTFPAGFQIDSDLNGFIGGGQAGFNYQVGQFVFGIEGDVSWSDIHGRETTASPLVAGRTSTTRTEIDWLAMVTGRAGLAFGNSLLYVKGGWAWGRFDSTSSTFTGAGVNIADTSGGETRDGYTIGGGIEWGLPSNWSLKAEYNFVDFGTDRVHRLVTSGTTAGTVLDRDADTQLHLFKVGINYRFGGVGGPVSARY